MSENITIAFSEFMKVARKAAALDILRALRLSERNEDVYVSDGVKDLIMGMTSKQDKQDK